jgi:hypothetical protein
MPVLNHHDLHPCFKMATDKISSPLDRLVDENNKKLKD